MVALNLGETGEITTESASNCWSKRWAKAGADATLVARAVVHICTTQAQRAGLLVLDQLRAGCGG